MYDISDPVDSSSMKKPAPLPPRVFTPIHSLRKIYEVLRQNKMAGKLKENEIMNAQQLEPNSALCKVCAHGNFYIVRCCVKGSLLEVNDRLIKQPDLLNSLADREGYVAIIMPRPGDWLKIKDSLLSYEDYVKLRGLS